MESMKAQFSAMNTVLTRHENQLADQTLLINKQSKRLDRLEDILGSQPTKPRLTDCSQSNRPTESTSPVQTEVQADKIDISLFSPQEKRILSIFFDHGDMALSYADIARTLGKSPNTIKNQMNQIGIKADLFNASLGSDNRKRFRFKKGFSIEKYLNFSRPVRQPDRLD